MVVEVTHLVGEHPGAAKPGELLADPPAQPSIVTEFALPQAGLGDPGQLIFIVIIEDSGAICPQVTIEVIHKRVRDCQIGDDDIGVATTEAVLADGSERVVAIDQREVGAGEGTVSIQGCIRRIDRDIRCRWHGESRRREGPAAGSSGQFIDIVDIESLHQRIVGPAVQVPGSIIGVSEAFMIPCHPTTGLFSLGFHQLPNVIVAVVNVVGVIEDLLGALVGNIVRVIVLIELRAARGLQFGLREPRVGIVLVANPWSAAKTERDGQLRRHRRRIEVRDVVVAERRAVGNHRLEPVRRVVAVGLRPGVAKRALNG